VGHRNRTDLRHEKWIIEADRGKRTVPHIHLIEKEPILIIAKIDTDMLIL
jgi:hypothetical protein